jgi:hypothetical protein
MASAFSITTATNNIPIGAQRSATVLFTVTNTSGQPLNGRAVLVMDPPNESQATWLQFNPPQKRERSFDVNGVQDYSVEVNVPVEAPAGDYLFHLDMVGTDNPDETYTAGPGVKLRVAEPEKKEKKPFPWWIIAVILGILAVIIGLVIFWPRPINKAADRIDQAIAELSNNSASWQPVMNSLVSDLNRIEKNVANDAQAIARRATAVSGVEFRCNADFIGNRVKEDLERLSTKLRNKIPPPVEPILCQLAFNPPQTDQTHINMASVPDEVLFYGYNFDTTSPDALELVLKHSGGEMSLEQWTTRPTHYLLTLKTVQSGGVQMCNLNDRTILLRSGGKELSSLGVIANVCPTPLPAPTPLPEKDLPGTPVLDRVFGPPGQSLEQIYGGQCSSGFVRSSFDINSRVILGEADVLPVGWVDPNNEQLCAIRVLYRFLAHAFGTNAVVDSTIIIKEKGEQLPAPEPPPCNCK